MLSVPTVQAGVGERLRMRVRVPDVPAGASITGASLVQAGYVRDASIDVVSEGEDAGRAVDVWIDAPESVGAGRAVLGLTTDGAEEIRVAVRVEAR